MILEYAFVGATDDIFVNLCADGCAYDEFDGERPSVLRGRVLNHDRFLLCSGQFELLPSSRVLGLRVEDVASATCNSCGAFFHFRENGNSLEATSSLYPEFTPGSTLRCLDADQERRWTILGAVLGDVHPLVALSRDLCRHLKALAPCNFRYLVQRHARSEVGDLLRSPDAAVPLT